VASEPAASRSFLWVIISGKDAPPSVGIFSSQPTGLVNSMWMASLTENATLFNFAAQANTNRTRALKAPDAELQASKPDPDCQNRECFAA
jgi:hypothetical protein